MGARYFGGESLVLRDTCLVQGTAVKYFLVQYFMKNLSLTAYHQLLGGWSFISF